MVKIVVIVVIKVVIKVVVKVVVIVVVKVVVNIVVNIVVKTSVVHGQRLTRALSISPALEQPRPNSRLRPPCPAFPPPTPSLLPPPPPLRYLLGHQVQDAGLACAVTRAVTCAP